MKRTFRIALFALLAGAGCLGSYKAPTGTGSGSKQPGPATGGSSSSGGSSSGASNPTPPASPDLGSPPASPPDMAAPPASPDLASPPTSATPSCDLLVQCCMGDTQCAAQFDNLSEDVCAQLLAGFQAQGACL